MSNANKYNAKKTGKRKENCQEPWNWLGLATLRGMCHRLVRLESMAPGVLCAF